MVTDVLLPLCWLPAATQLYNSQRTSWIQIHGPRHSVLVLSTLSGMPATALLTSNSCQQQTQRRSTASSSDIVSTKPLMSMVQTLTDIAQTVQQEAPSESRQQADTMMKYLLHPSTKQQPKYHGYRNNHSYGEAGLLTGHCSSSISHDSLSSQSIVEDPTELVQLPTSSARVHRLLSDPS